MELLIVRHGIAEERSPALPDSERALTDRGRRRLADVLRGLQALGWTVDRLLCSPWVRAAQTAELLAPLSAAAPQPCDDLARRPGPELLARLSGGSVGLVGHEPWLTQLAGWLVTGAPDAGMRFVLKKGGVLRLAGAAEPGGMSVLALVPPRAFRRGATA